jgi:hypothetical protein
MSGKTVRMLDTIAANDGMRFRDIQKLLWNMSNDTPFTRDLRGYWCTNLLGGEYYHQGILRFFCVKQNGLWHRRLWQPHFGKPWATMKKALDARS